jgi:hypothetical protein
MVKCRFWNNGSFLATWKTSHAAGVLEFDGNGRYHVVHIGSNGWHEANFDARKQSFRLSSAHGPNEVVTHWSTPKANGLTTRKAGHPVTWEQTVHLASGGQKKILGAGLVSRAEVVSSDGHQLAAYEMSGVLKDKGNQTYSGRNRDGSTYTTTIQTRYQADGSTVSVNQTQTVSNDRSTTTNTTTTNTTNRDGSSSSTQQSVSVSVDGSTTTTTTTNRAADGSTNSKTESTDSATGQSVTTETSSSTSTDSAGNTVVTETVTVSSSDGFRSSQTTSTSSDGSVTVNRTTTDTDGNIIQTSTQTDAQGNVNQDTITLNSDGTASAESLSTDAQGYGTRTTTDSNGNTSTEPVEPDQANPGGGTDGGGEGGGQGGGEGGNSGGEGGGNSGGGEMPSDDGTEEGPRSYTSRAGFEAASLAYQAEHQPGTGDDSGSETSGFAGRLSNALGSYVGRVEANGWGDAASEGATRPPLSSVEVPLSSAVDDWGNLVNPRAIVAFTAQVALQAARVGGAAARAAAARVIGSTAHLNAQ